VTSRRCLAATAWFVAIVQLTLGTVAPVMAARVWDGNRPAATTAEEDCCAGSHPGQACPMHRRQASPAPVPDAAICRLTCAEPDAYAMWLASAIGWVPGFTRWVYRERSGIPATAPAATPLIDVALTPLSPPPRS
jgi:hypothetical protein